VSLCCCHRLSSLLSSSVVVRSFVRSFVRCCLFSFDSFCYFFFHCCRVRVAACRCVLLRVVVLLVPFSCRAMGFFDTQLDVRRERFVAQTHIGAVADRGEKQKRGGNIDGATTMVVALCEQGNDHLKKVW